jgi:hypothetical protein
MNINYPIRCEIINWSDVKVEEVIHRLSDKRVRIVFVHAMYTTREKAPEDKSNMNL